MSKMATLGKTTHTSSKSTQYFYTKVVLISTSKVLESTDTKVLILVFFKDQMIGKLGEQVWSVVVSVSNA